MQGLPCTCDAVAMATRIVFPQTNEVELEEIDVGDPLAGFLRVRTLCSLMSTGTEGIVLRRLFDEDSHWALYAVYPFYPGYAVVGVVEEVGPDIEGKDFNRFVIALKSLIEQAAGQLARPA